MRQQEQTLDDLRVQVCVVTFDAGPLAMSYVRETRLTWPLLIDIDRSLYQAYGMTRGTWWKLFGPAAIGVYLKLLLRGRRLKRPGSDVHQLAGDVLIDSAGIVRFHYVGSGPADRPAIAELLRTIRS